MKTKAFIFILINLLTIFLLGCWDAMELDELGITLIMGFDVEDEKVLLTAEVIQPVSTQNENGSGNKSSVKYIQGTGNNIFEAYRDITLKFDRRIFGAHTKVVIFGEDFAKRGLASHIDELIREREHRETAYILIAKEAKAYEVMGINVGLERIPGVYILDTLSNIRNNPKTMDANFVEYFKNYFHEGHHPTTGIIERRNVRSIDQTTEEETQKYSLSVLGSAVFDDEILVGYLNGNDTKSLNFLLDKIIGGIITFPTPQAMPESTLKTNPTNEGLSSVVIINNKTKNDIEIVGGKVLLKTTVNLRGAVGEVVGNIDISMEENLKKMEEACSKAIEVGIKNAVKKVQDEFKLDIFGFGMIFHRKYPKEWKDVKEDWDEIFSEADFQVKVNTNIIRTGLMNTPIYKKKAE